VQNKNVDEVSILKIKEKKDIYAQDIEVSNRQRSLINT
jgi:hypothetical protein